MGKPAESLTADCVAYIKVPVNNGELYEAFGEVTDALKRCNADKKALRKFYQLYDVKLK